MPATPAARSIVHSAARARSCVGAGRVLGEERLVGVAFLEQEAVQRERDRQIGAGTHREVQVGLRRERRASADR